MKTNQEKSTFKHSIKKYKVTIIILLTTIGLHIAALLFPWTSVMAKYPFYLIKCGGQPISASKFAASFTYDIPGDKFYSVGFGASELFCTEQEAQAAGYRKSGLN